MAWPRRSLPADGERVEARVAVVDVHALGALEAVHHEVRQRRGESLIGALGEPLREDSGEHRRDGDNAGEGQHGEDEGVEALADKGGADGAAPEPAAVGGDLHPGEDDGVGELADEIGDEGRREQARGVAEDAIVGTLGVPEGGGGEQAGDGDGQHRQEVAEKAQPYDAARRPEAVDLSEDVAKDVAYREDQSPSVQHQPERADELHRRYVRRDKARHEDRHDHHERERVPRGRLLRVLCPPRHRGQ